MNASPVNSNTASSNYTSSISTNTPLSRRICSIAATAFSTLAIIATAACVCSLVPLWVPTVLFATALVTIAIGCLQRNRNSKNVHNDESDKSLQQRVPNDGSSLSLDAQDDDDDDDDDNDPQVRAAGVGTASQQRVVDNDDSESSLEADAQHDERSRTLTTAQEIQRPGILIKSADEPAPASHAFPFKSFHQFFNHIRSSNILIGNDIYDFNWNHWKIAISNYLESAGIENRWDLIVCDNQENLLHYLLLKCFHKQHVVEEGIKFLIAQGLSHHRDSRGRTPIKLFHDLLENSAIYSRPEMAAAKAKGALLPPNFPNFDKILMLLILDAKKNKEEFDLELSFISCSKFKYLLDLVEEEDNK